jgi:hypothetical protein
MSKWTSWYNSLPEHTKIYLKGQPLWHDKDMALAVSIGMAFGFVFGFICR